ncbi:MAG TPA: UDP-N-acetylglucosamine 4,6-dehydratase (inverting) [Sulfurimonas sp.]|nr:UDP-N-acetylglucosamine 4,6-dehydratase (inverting) [Sulfurimonas sp.]
MLNNKQILITGGTGSFGRAFVRYVFEHYPDIKRVVIFSRDEQKQHEMAAEFSPKAYPIKYMLGDVRDLDRVMKVSRGIDILIHAAAMKHVPASEQNPMECVKTNILGAQNVIDAALENGIKKVVALSTDKSANPINVYGASKLMLEKLFVFADAEKMEQDIKFSVVRYGNIFGSKGSVVPFFLKKKSEGVLPITHTEMTRFSITMQESIDLVMYALEKGWGGEVMVPIAPSYKVTDIAKAIAPDIKHKIVGIRKGEKLHEVLLTSEESFDTVRRENYYIICPSEGNWCRDEYCEKTNTVAVEDGFEYNSESNNMWLCVEDIEKLINDKDMM